MEPFGSTLKPDRCRQTKCLLSCLNLLAVAWLVDTPLSGKHRRLVYTDLQSPRYPDLDFALAAKVLMSVRPSIVGAAQSSVGGELRNAEERDRGREERDGRL